MSTLSKKLLLSVLKLKLLSVGQLQKKCWIVPEIGKRRRVRKETEGKEKTTNT